MFANQVIDEIQIARRTAPGRHHHEGIEVRHWVHLKESPMVVRDADAALDRLPCGMSAKGLIRRIKYCPPPLVIIVIVIVIAIVGC